MLALLKGELVAALVLLAEDGDLVLTSDPSDLVPLAAAAGLHLDVTAV